MRELQGRAAGKHPGANPNVSWVKDCFDYRAAHGKPTPGDLEGLLHATDPELPAGFVYWQNPAYKAMQLLEQALGDKLTYLHGNHDNYLILPEVTSYLGLKPRKPAYEARGLMVEHGHRMERYFAGFVAILPHNYDGDPTGYDATIKAYKTAVAGGWKQELAGDAKVIADKFAEVRDQPSYEHEYARVWLGRESLNRPLPHVFAIGHTHDPKLVSITIDAYGG
jgi:hypothetical protein